MKVVFLSPHSRISGGVKVIFRLAAGLKEKGIDVSVCVKKMNDKTLEWYGSERPSFPVLEVPEPSYRTLPGADVVINYGDGDPFIPLHKNTKQVLFLQHFGVHSPLEEKVNLMHPYDGVVVTSSWLRHVARKCGHKRVYQVPPGIDDVFKPMPVGKCPTPVIGTLYHEAPFKNSLLFIEIIEKLVTKHKKEILPVLLTARPITKIPEFDKLEIQYSIRVNPPIWTLASLYSYCTAWVSPALIEGFGLTTLEAMACRCPVITMRNFGLDDYLSNGKNCFIMKDVAHGVSIINAILDQKLDLKPVLDNGQKLSAMFTWPNAINSFHGVLQDVVRARS